MFTTFAWGCQKDNGGGNQPTPQEPSGTEKPEEPGIAKSLVTTGATTEAQALYNYLREIYGQKTLSAIMANVNWNHEEADKVYQATGKYPAINCYDFIHILYSGANWINYSNLTPVTEWVDEGGIVSLMWHFNVPQSEKSGIDKVTCTPSETTFRARNVFTEGTWENKWFYEQMDKVAAVILGLQKKGLQPCGDLSMKPPAMPPISKRPPGPHPGSGGGTTAPRCTKNCGKPCSTISNPRESETLSGFGPRRIITGTAPSTIWIAIGIPAMLMWISWRVTFTGIPHGKIVQSSQKSNIPIRIKWLRWENAAWTVTPEKHSATSRFLECRCKVAVFHALVRL